MARRTPDDEYDRHADDPDRDDPPAPSEATFWRAYSPNLEFPIATLASILAHVLMVTGLFSLLLAASCSGAKDTSPVKVSLVDGGFDKEGAGSPGSGGEAEPLAVGSSKPQPLEEAFLPLPNEQLPKINDKLMERYELEDPTASVAINKDRAAAILDDTLREKIDALGQRRGNGPGQGKGDTGQPGNGPGGAGADATRARSLRWVLKFKTSSGRDYLDQLQSLGADVVLPIPPDDKTARVFRAGELGGGPGRLMAERDWTMMAQQIQFCDYKPESIRQVSQALGVQPMPHCFWAFFPKTLEAELARKEMEHQNKRPEDIEETVFQVVARAGKYELVVARQILKQ